MYRTFFEDVTGFPPYPYQQRLGEADRWPELVRVGTGLGKTEAAVVAWLWRRFRHPDPETRTGTPRRLVYCLPMRTLVEQTVSRIERILERFAAHTHAQPPAGPFVLMGGVDRQDWRQPEREAILVGTQDILISRALNRGYGMSRFQWPIDYALLNNDVLWVLDEIQLMGATLPTSAQLQAFRQDWETFGPTHTLWMSATCEPDWLATVDHAAPAPDRVHALDPSDLGHERVETLWHASKRIERGEPVLESTAKAQVGSYLETTADLALRLHDDSTAPLNRRGALSNAVAVWLPRDNVDLREVSAIGTRSQSITGTLPHTKAFRTHGSAVRQKGRHLGIPSSTRFQHLEGCY